MLNVAHLTQDLTSLFGECRKCSPMKCRIFVASRMYWNNKKYNKHDHQNLQYFVYLFFFDTELQNCAKPLPNPSNLTDSSTHTHTHTQTQYHTALTATFLMNLVWPVTPDSVAQCPFLTPSSGITHCNLSFLDRVNDFWQNWRHSHTSCRFTDKNSVHT